MTERILKPFTYAVGLLVVAAAIAQAAQPVVAAGILVGGAWNLASLWCLTNLIRSWLNPIGSRRRTIGWLILKLAVVYPSAILVLQFAPQLAIGFGIGFTLVLAVMLAAFASGTLNTPQTASHGR